MDEPIRQQRQQQQQEEELRQTQQTPRRSRHLEVLVFVLVFAAFVLGGAFVLLGNELAAKRLARAEANEAALNKGKKKSSSSSIKKSLKTVKHFIPHSVEDLHVSTTSATSSLASFSNDPRKRSSTYQNKAELYWKQAESWLATWDPNLQQNSNSFLEWEVDAETALQSLRMAAELGHAQAQFYTSVAYWSGIWPISTTTTTISNNNSDTLNDNNNNTKSSSSSAHIKIMQDWWTSHHSAQHTQAALWLHFAAMAGHEEAAIAMASKSEATRYQQSTGQANPFFNPHASSSTLNTCQTRLPYAEAAADLIIDRLQASPELGRGKVLPSGDKHVLYQLHLFGSKSSKYLEAHNQPDESLQALQFYQVQALAASPSSDGSAAGGDGGGGGDSHASKAAFTLGQLYYTGHRGVTQNLTAALYWYQVAARLGHAEAAGHAGDCWLYGIGTGDEGPNPYQAYKWYQQGTPFAIEGCRRKWEQKLAKKGGGDHSSTGTFVCDATCLNGMGVILLLGLPMMVTADMGLAEKYFELAKEQGKHDAAYNLAMLKLGWKTHWRTTEEAEELERGEAEKQKQDAKEEAEAALSGKKAKHPPFKTRTSPGMPQYSLTRSEWQAIVTDLSIAAGAGHLQARHRLAKLYANGVQIEVAKSTGQSATEQHKVVPQDCDKALKNFKWVVDHASPSRNIRLRSAYKQYMAGDLESSLRNYLVAAETGSDLAHLNAAFLLEQGTCLGLSEVDCAKAAVRLYKAAAARGHGEASMRVGDFYYYGRFRSDLPSGPFGWLQYILYPEKYLVKLLLWTYQKYYLDMREMAMMNESAAVPGTGEGEGGAPGTCAASAENEATCRRLDSSHDSGKKKDEEDEEEQHSFQHDMERAAHYYRFAAEKTASMRANFNLGFMYEWGLGLKQDFPLAKRHYDLAISTNSRDSDLPVSIALHCLSLHEKVVKLYLSWKEWSSADVASTEESDKEEQENDAAVPRAAESKEHGRPVPPSAPRDGGGTTREKQMEILLRHLLSLESLLIFVLTVVLWMLLQRRT